MIVDSFSYVVSMLSVYGAMIVLIILFPLVMWRNYLTGKPFGEKILFCVITQTFYLVNMVMLLGLLHICNIYTMTFMLFAEYLLVWWTYSDRTFFARVSELWKLFLLMIQGQMTAFEVRRSVSVWFTSRRRGIRRPNWKWLNIRTLFPIVFMAGIFVYNAWFLTYQVRIYHSYQFSDLPVHTSWVYGLEHGQIFSAGIYPFAMHAMIYIVGTFFRLETREVVLFFGSFQTLLTIFALYMFSKQIFRWKYSALLAVLLWSIMLNQGRYAASLPQECGVFSFFTIAYYLTKILHSRKVKHVVPTDSKVRSIFRMNQYLSRKYLNYDFFMLTLSVCLAIAFHFYTAIAAVVFAVCIVAAHLPTFLKKQYFVPIVAAAVVGAMLAVIPFVIAFASGIPLQESLEWAMSVINGEEWQGTGYGYLESVTGEQGEEPEEPEQAPQEDNQSSSVFSRGLPAGELVKTVVSTMSQYTSATLFGFQIDILLLVCILVTAVFSAVFLFIPPLREYIPNYLALVLTAAAFVFMGSSYELGVTVILDANRSSVFLQPFYFLIMAMAFDAIFAIPSLIPIRMLRPVLAVLSVLLLGAAGYTLVSQGYLHHYFDVNLAYYNEPDFLISRIRKTNEKNTFTVVSPTDEYYAVVQHGFHYELSELVADVGNSDKIVKIPTPYIYFFIEKYTLQDYFYDRDYVGEKYALMDFAYRASTQDYFYQRNIIESKAYYWAQRFAELYPNQMQVYFEDDIYIAYVLVQDPNTPLDLNVEYLSFLGGE